MDIIIKKADSEAKEMYENLMEVADDIVNSKVKEVDALVKKIGKEIDVLTNDKIRVYMIQLSIFAYDISKFKEQSSLKNDCADALYKQGLANSFVYGSGTVEGKKQDAVLDNMDKQAVRILYDAVSNMFKTKLDEIHRMTNTLSNVLISRQAEAKLQYSPRSESTAEDVF